MVAMRKKVCNWLFVVLVLFSCVYTYIMFLASSNYSNQKSLKDVKFIILNEFNAANDLRILTTTENLKTTTKSDTTTSDTVTKNKIHTTKPSSLINQTIIKPAVPRPVIKIHRPPLVVGKVSNIHFDLTVSIVY